MNDSIVVVYVTNNIKDNQLTIRQISDFAVVNKECMY